MTLKKGLRSCQNSIRLYFYDPSQANETRSNKFKENNIILKETENS
jgi:hypothetical protein